MLIDQAKIDEIRNLPEVPIPDDQSDNAQFAGLAYQHAYNWLVDGSGTEYVPTWALLTRKGHVIVVSTPFEMPEDKIERYKDFVADEMARLMEALDIVRYSFCSEAWMTVRTKEQWATDKRQPSKCDDRKEVIIVTSADKNSNYMAVYEMVRDWETGKITDLKKIDQGESGGSSAGGRFANLLSGERE